MPNEMTAMPVRIQRSRKHKQVSPNGLPIVYVGRPGKWGNPYRLVATGAYCFNVVYVSKYGQLLIARALPKDMALKLAIEKYKDGMNPEVVKEHLSGKNLSCWCKPGEPCHADILLEIANQKFTQ